MGEASADTQERPGVVRERVSANLREARQAAGLTLEQLAERTALHPVAVRRVEEEAAMPRLDTLLKLADSLGVPVEALCAGVAWDVERQRFR
jgi:transcriptional regulator with XRE-family HTH domain